MTTSAPGAGASSAGVSGAGVSGVETVRVWDPLVRVFHGSLVLAFFGAYMLGDDGDALHQALDYAVLGLVAVRPARR